MVSALEYFEKCAGTRLDNYLQGGTGFGASTDLALSGSGVNAEELDAAGLDKARHRGRALEAVGSLGLGALGAAGVAGMHHPMNEWFDNLHDTGRTLGDMAEGSGLGLAGGLALPAIAGHSDAKKLIDEAKHRRATGNQAPDLPATNAQRVGESNGSVSSEMVPQQ